MAITNFEDLQVWQVSMDLCEIIYKISGEFPKNEQFGLTSQIQRASVSIPSNIAEGCARDSSKELLHHLSIALGSLAELRTQVILAKRLGYMNEQVCAVVLSKSENIGRMLKSFQRSIKTKVAV